MEKESKNDDYHTIYRKCNLFSWSLPYGSYRTNKEKGACLTNPMCTIRHYGSWKSRTGGVSGLISNLVSILRNVICLKFKFTIPLKIIFIAIQFVLTFIFNSEGIFGWLPAIAAAIFTWFLDVKSDVQLKYVIIFTELFWIVYDIHNKNFSSLFFDIMTIITSIIGIYRLHSAKS